MFKSSNVKKKIETDGSAESSDAPLSDPQMRNGGIRRRLSNFKEVTAAVVKEVARPQQSSFRSWKSAELREILVVHNVQVRGAKEASHDTLVRICDEVFGPDGGSKITPPRRSYTIEEMSEMSDAARKIQHAFIHSKCRAQNATVILPGDEENQFGDQSNEAYGGIEREAFISLNEATSLSFHEVAHRQQDPAMFREATLLRRVRQNNLDDELEVKWRKPSYTYAKKYEAANRPHMHGKDMIKYTWNKATSGRHCYPGGCGEQLDLWNEGHTSEFSQFGSGVTNYFKFLKWCCWVLFALSCIHMPILIVNMFGVSLQMDSSFAASTTLGNLGSAAVVTSVQIPGCDKNDYQFDACKIDKDRLAMYYALTDVAGTVMVILAWLWLRQFEKKEVEHLNKNTVAPSDYTLRVFDIPPDTSERELAVHFAQLTGEAVSEVHLAYRIAHDIELYFTRGELMRERFECVQRIRYEKTVGRDIPGKQAASERRLAHKMKERERLTTEIYTSDAIRRERGETAPEAIQAFVTFDEQVGLVKSIAAYQLSWVRSGCCLYPKKLKFKGSQIRVALSPDPSTLIWENLEVPSSSRFFRKCLTTSVATLAIFLSIIFTFLARDFRSQTLISGIKPCPEGFLDLSSSQQYELIKSDTDLSLCYCASLTLHEQWKEELCKSYYTSKMKSSAMNYGASFMVVFMNAFFTFLMNKAGNFERHQSLDTMEGSNMSRVFFLKFVNTGCLVLLYSQRWLQRLVRVKFEDPQNFNVDWYQTGGVGIMTVMCMNIISPHLGSILHYRKHKAKIRALERNLTKDGDTDDNYKIWYSQEDLNEIYVGPSFRLSDRYSHLLVTFYICWTYAISMPLMPVIGALSFYVSYWVDKFLFCNYYKIPPKYSDDIGKTSTRLIGVAILLHLIMSAWMLGNQEIFVGENVGAVREKKFVGSALLRDGMMKKHVLLLELVAVAFVASQIAEQALKSLGHTCMMFLRCLVCSKGNKDKEMLSTMNKLQSSYSYAKKRGLIKGLASYNMLQSPKYQEAFGISSEFATAHHRLSSIRGMNTKEGDLCFSSTNSNYEAVSAKEKA